MNATVNEPGNTTAPLLVSGYVHDGDYSLTLVLINPSSGPVTATVQVPGNPAGLSSFQAYISSNGSYWQNLQARRDQRHRDGDGSRATAWQPSTGLVSTRMLPVRWASRRPA